MQPDKITLIALGSNQNGPWGTPRQTVEKALKALDEPPFSVVRASSLIETVPFGMTDQANFINAVAIVETDLNEAEVIMQRLHLIEKSASRERFERWGPRTLDLDLIDFDGLILDGDGEIQGHNRPLVLPHPGIAEREFVLRPIAEIAPAWRHPINGLSAVEMLRELPLNG